MLMNVGEWGYDEAGAVAVKINGCPAHILRHNNTAYTYCFSHV